MGSLEAYEAGLQMRLAELRMEEVSYQMHRDSMFEAIMYCLGNFGHIEKPRFLDGGCGLGFFTRDLTRSFGGGVMGIDVSNTAIEMAKIEHPNVKFQRVSIEDLGQEIVGGNVLPFNFVILNMVLHSIDDNTVNSVLRGTRNCLVPGGCVISVLPDKDWLVHKLIEEAERRGMGKYEGVPWVSRQLQSPVVEMPVKIEGGQYYPLPLTIYNRTIDDYGKIYLKNDLGVGQMTCDSQGTILDVQVDPFYAADDYSVTYELGQYTHNRRTLISTALDRDWREGKWRDGLAAMALASVAAHEE